MKLLTELIKKSKAMQKIERVAKLLSKYEKLIFCRDSRSFNSLNSILAKNKEIYQ